MEISSMKVNNFCINVGVIGDVTIVNILKQEAQLSQMERRHDVFIVEILSPVV